MALVRNFPGPYEIRHFYSRAGITHEQRLNIDLQADIGPGQTFGDYTVKYAQGGSEILQTVMDAYITSPWKPLFGNAMTSEIMELWKYTPGTFSAQLYSVYATGVVGTAAGTYSPAKQHTVSFATVLGGKMFWEAMEATVDTTDGQFAPTALSAPWDNLVAYIVGAASPFIGRDGAAPFAARKISVGQNEALFRKIYRAG